MERGIHRMDDVPADKLNQRQQLQVDVTLGRLGAGELIGMVLRYAHHETPSSRISPTSCATGSGMLDRCRSARTCAAKRCSAATRTQDR